jgi:hypothetical protein
MNGGSSPATQIRKGHVESPHWLPMDLPETLAAASRSFRENVVLAARCLGQAVSAAMTVRLGWTLMLVLLMITAIGSAQGSSPFVQLDRSDTTSGYLASLLINEVPFPGERAYVSEADTKNAMLQILWVLDSRIHQIPPGYLQQQVAGVRSQNIIDVITGAGGRRQCEGFYRNAAGQFVTDARVRERIDNLLGIANGGGKPGRFAGLLNHAQGLARAYVKNGIEEADRYAGLKQVGPLNVTGHAYSWMTDVDSYHPGGNFVSIPDAYDGSLGGNRFFTLRKAPK